MKNLFIALVFSFASLSASTSALAESSSAASVAEAEPAAVVTVADREPGFMDKYFPFGLPNNLEPEVAQGVPLIWLLAVLAPCGPLWAPPLLTGQGFPDDFVVDMFISEIVHLASQFIPVVGFCLVPLNCLYFCPVATIAIYDRNLKQERRGKRRAQLEGPPAAAPQEPVVSMSAMAY